MYRWFRWYFNFLFWFSFTFTARTLVLRPIYEYGSKYLSFSQNAFFFYRRLFLLKSQKRHVVNEPYQNCIFAQWCGVWGISRSPLPQTPPTTTTTTSVTAKLSMTGPFTAMYGCDSAFRYILVGLLHSGCILTVRGWSYGVGQQGHIIL